MVAPARLDDFFASVPESEALPLPDGVAVTFDLVGDGGGTWTVERRKGQISVMRREVPNPDCRLQCSVQDFRALVGGDLDPRQGFLEGRFEVEGDVGLVLRLQRITR